jgi:hypothetical protein
VQLLGEVSEPDSMMRLNQTLGVIIARVEGHVSASDESVPRTLDLHILTASPLTPQIAPYSQQLAVILEQMWQTCQESHSQTSILVTFTRLCEVSSSPKVASSRTTERVLTSLSSCRRHSVNSRNLCSLRLAKSSAPASTRQT